MINIIFKTKNKIKKISKWCFSTKKRKLIFSLFLILFILAPLSFYFFNKEVSASWWNDAWHYRKSITINSAQIPGDLTNYPMLVSFTDGNLINKAQTDGDDIIFIQANGERLDHEIEKYNNATGELIAWVKIPQLDGDSDSTIYMYYGNRTVDPQQRPDDVWDDNYKAIQHLKESGTGTRYDSTRNNNDAFTQNYDGDESTSSGTKIGNADILDGNNDFLKINDNAGLDFTDNYTVSFWVKTSNVVSGWDVFLSKESWTANSGWFVMHDDGGFLRFYSNSGSPKISFANPLLDQQWHFVTMVVASGSASLIVDGVSVGTSASALTANDVKVFIGARHTNDGSDNPTDYLNGTIDEVRISNAPRSANWITTEYNNQNSPATFISLGSEERGTAPILYLPLDEGYGTIAHDESSNKNNGTITGATWKDESLCVSGKCLGFGTSSQYIARTDQGVGDPLRLAGGEVTLEAWVRSTNGASEQKIIDKRNAWNGLYGYSMFIDSANNLYFEYGNGTAYSQLFGTGTNNALTINKWHHVAVTLSGATVSYFVDGKSYGTRTGVAGIAGDATTFSVGYSVGRSSNSFFGSIDEPKIYSYARTASQIKQDYNSGLAGISSESGTNVSLGDVSNKWLTDGLVGHWKMDETSGTMVSDVSGNSNNGTLINAQETGTSDASGNTVNTIIDTDGALATTDDAYNGMIFRTTAVCGSISAGTERLISDYNGATKTFSTVLALASIPNSCPYEIRHQVGGEFGNGVRFDGSNDYIDSGNGTTLNIDSEITVSSWVKFNNLDYVGNTGVLHGIAGKGVPDSASPNSGWWLSYDNRNNGKGFGYTCFGNSAGGFAGGVNNFSGSNYEYTFTNGTWYNISFTIMGNQAKLYINGAQHGPTKTLSNLQLSDVTRNLIIGKVSSGYTIKGSIDETRIYNRALSSDEVHQLYSYAPSPILHLKMDEKSGTTAFDSSGNNNNGNLNNGPIWESGKNNGALLLDGNNDTVSGSLINTASKTAVTLEAWVWIKSLDQRPSVLCSSPSAYCLFVVPTGNLQMYLRSDQGWAGVQTTDSYSWTDGWHHIVSTYNADEQKVKLYRDGKLVYTGTRTGLIDANVTGFTVGTENSNYFKGLIDDVKIYNYARTQEQILEDMGGQDGPTSSSNMALKKPILDLNFNEGQGAITNDASGNENNGTLVSGATGINTTPTMMWDKNGKEGGAMGFDGSDDYVSIPDNPAIRPASLSISAWVRKNAGGSGAIVTKAINTISGKSYDLNIGSNGNIHFEVQTGVGYPYWNTANGLISDNIWHHVVVTFSPMSGNSSDSIMYVDGKKISTTYVANGYIAGQSLSYSSLDLNIGRENAYAVPIGYFSGLIDEVKIYNYVLGEDEVKTLYNDSSAMAMGNDKSRNNNGTAVTGANKYYCIPGDSAKCDKPVLELKMDEKNSTTAYDTSGNGFNGTLNGGPIWDAGKFGSGINLGNNNYVSVPDNVQLRPGTGDFTSSIWIKVPFSASVIGTWPNIFSKGASTTAPAHTWGFSRYTGQSNGISFQQSSDAGGTFDVSLSALNLSNGWHFAVARRSGTTTQLYIDGKFYSEDTSAESDLSSSSNVNFGGNFSDGSYFLGSVDEASYFNYARTPAQIAWDYNRGKPIGHWKFDENEGLAAHDETGNNNGTLTNMDTTDWVAGKNNKALDFDGTNDYVNVGSNIKYTNSVTYSAWIKPDIIQNEDHIVRKNLDTLRLRADGRLEFTIDATEWGGHLSTSSVSAGVWNHVVATFDDSSNTLRYYINGKKDSELTYAASITTSGPGTYPMFIGENAYIAQQGVSLFDGQIDDVKIFNYALNAEQVKMEYNGGAINFE